MNFVNAGVKGGRILMPLHGARHITRAVREDAPKDKCVLVACGGRTLLCV